MATITGSNLDSSLTINAEHFKNILDRTADPAGRKALEELLAYMNEDTNTEWSYRKVVVAIAEEAFAEAVDGLGAGDDDTLRESASEHADQSVDGNYWVIYTHAARKTLLFSDNEDAYFDDFGYDLDTTAGIPYSKLAYFAMRADVEEKLSALIDEQIEKWEAEEDEEEGEEE